MTRVLGVLGALGLVVGLLAGPASLPAVAQDPASQCRSDGGIYVYVLDQGSEVLAGCTHAETGMGRLLELTTVQTAGAGFICRIAGRPERCLATPGGDEPYWGYWWWRPSAEAPEGQWQYATIGGSYKGVPGSVEAWHFSVGEQPPFQPSAVEAAVQPASEAPGPSDSTPQTQGWGATAPTAATVAFLGVGGYGLWRRRRNRG